MIRAAAAVVTVVDAKVAAAVLVLEDADDMEVMVVALQALVIYVSTSHIVENDVAKLHVDATVVMVLVWADVIVVVTVSTSHMCILIVLVEQVPDESETPVLQTVVVNVVIAALVVKVEDTFAVPVAEEVVVSVPVLATVAVAVDKVVAVVSVLVLATVAAPSVNKVLVSVLVAAGVSAIAVAVDKMVVHDPGLGPPPAFVEPMHWS